MNIFGRVPGFSGPRLGKRILVFVLSWSLLFATWPRHLSAQDAQAPAPGGAGAAIRATFSRAVAAVGCADCAVSGFAGGADPGGVHVPRASRRGRQMGAGASGFEGRRIWVEGVDQQPWDPSVKALAAFPSVLGNMDKNLSWTSSLGDAYYNQQQDVMDAVQVMRQRAEQSGNLRTTPQQTVTTQGSTVIIEPASPDVVYVPAYDPWLVYGDPIVAWPGWYPYPGIWFGGPYLSFGIGFGIGWFGGFGWGWGHWGCDWHNRYAIYNHDRYYSRSRTFYNRNTFYRDGGGRGWVNNRPGAATRSFNGNRPADRGEAGPRDRSGVRSRAFNSGAAARSFNGNRPAARGYAGPRSQSSVRSGTFRSGAAARPFNGNRQAARGYANPRGQSSVRSGVFSGYGHGGQTRSFSSRGSASFMAEERVAGEECVAAEECAVAEERAVAGAGVVDRRFVLFLICRNLKMEGSHMRRTKRELR